MNAENDWTVYRTRFLVRARQLTDSLQFTDALGRQHSGEPGDYLVEIFDGLLSITPRKFFEDIYVALDPHSGNSETSNPVSEPAMAVNDRIRENSDRHPVRISPAAASSRGSSTDRTTAAMVPRAPVGRTTGASLIA